MSVKFVSGFAAVCSASVKIVPILRSSAAYSSIDLLLLFALLFNDCCIDLS
jgi:hypothetical protein